MTTQTTHGKTQQKLPPGERDFQVYRLVTIEQKSTRTAAKIAGVSQTRVCQIVERVAEFLIATAPTTEDPARKQQQLNVAQQAAAEQIRYLSQQAMRCFQKSIGPKTTVRQAADGSPLTTTRQSDGDCRYLFAVAKLAVIGSKLPLAGMLGGGETGDEALETAEAAPTPTDGACSVATSEQGFTATQQAMENDAKNSKTKTSDDSSKPQPSRKVENAQPVHRASAPPLLSPEKQVTRDGFLRQPPFELTPFAKAALNLE